MTVIVSLASLEMAGTVLVSVFYYLISSLIELQFHKTSDIDECALSEHNCIDNKVCSNIAGSYECLER